MTVVIWLVIWEALLYVALPALPAGMAMPLILGALLVGSGAATTATLGNYWSRMAYMVAVVWWWTRIPAYALALDGPIRDMDGAAADIVSIYWLIVIPGALAWMPVIDIAQRSYRRFMATRQAAAAGRRSG